MVRTQVAFQPAYQQERKISHIGITFPQSDNAENLHTLCLSQGDQDTESRLLVLVPVCHIRTST